MANLPSEEKLLGQHHNLVPPLVFPVITIEKAKTGLHRLWREDEARQAAFDCGVECTTLNPKRVPLRCRSSVWGSEIKVSQIGHGTHKTYGRAFRLLVGRSLLVKMVLVDVEDREVKEWDTDSVQNEAGCANGDGEFAFVLLEPSVTNETRREKGVRGR